MCWTRVVIVLHIHVLDARSPDIRVRFHRRKANTHAVTLDKPPAAC